MCRIDNNIVRELVDGIIGVLSDNVVQIILYGSQARGDQDDDSDNYFVLITRETLPMLPYSITEIYGMRLNNVQRNLKDEDL